MQLLALLPSSKVVGGAGGWKGQRSDHVIGPPGNQCPFLGAFQNNGINIISGAVERGLLMNNKRQSFHVYAPEVTGMSLILLCFTLLASQIMWFYILKVQASLSAPFFRTAFAHFMSLCHILIIRKTFQAFSLLLYLFWWCDQFSSVVSNSLRPHGLHAACQASLSITNTWSLLILMYIESLMPSNYLTLCHPVLLLPSIFPSIMVFSNESERIGTSASASVLPMIFRTDFL